MRRTRAERLAAGVESAWPPRRRIAVVDSFEHGMRRPSVVIERDTRVPYRVERTDMAGERESYAYRPPLPMSARQVRSWRAIRGLRQDDMATLLGVNTNTIWAWESGKREPMPYITLAFERLDQLLREEFGIIPLNEQPEVKRLLVDAQTRGSEFPDGEALRAALKGGELAE
jgi:DNA-binding XRE family transcriptional regulator